MNLEALESAVAARTEHTMSSDRRAALDALLEHGLPDRRSELWKYTKAEPLAAFALKALATPRTEAALDGALNQHIADRLASQGAEWHLVFVDGVVAPALTALPDGVSLTEAGAEAPAGSSSADDAFALMNAALPGTSLALAVAADVQVRGVLHVVHALSADDALAQVRLSLELGERASLTVAEHFAGDTAAGMHNTVITVRLAEAARLRLRRLQSLGEDTLQVTRIEADLAAHASLDAITVDAGGKTVRNDLNVRLQGEGARVDMSGVYLGNANQHIDNHTRVDHIARDTISREDYRGILRDRSRGVFNGKVFVHEGADGTDAAQSNPNLLLSDHAEIDTKPELEIYADDVKCAHGATVGQIDDTSLFYLRSRGIDAATAMQLLTYAFCREVLTGIDNDALRIAAEQLVAEQIPDFSALELIA